MSITISVVMPTYNRRETLAEVLPSLAEQNYPSDSYELLLCDSGSTDGTEELLQQLAIPNLRYLVGENRGRAGARNRGIQAATGEVILFTDADIIADQNLLAEHARIHEAETNVAIVGCEVQVNSLQEYHSVVGDPERRRHMHRRPRRELQWYFYLTGNASARRQTLIDVGAFDENFIGYGHEDIELGYRLKKHGVPILYNPRAVNYHWHPVPFDEKCSKMGMAGRSTVRFWRKHRDPMIKLRLGVNPATMLLHRLFPAGSAGLRYCERRAQQSPFCAELVLQHHYLNGVKAALAEGEQEAKEATVGS